MDDPLTSALKAKQAAASAQQAHSKTQREKSDARLAEVLPPLKQQIWDWLSAVPFFDGGVLENAGTIMNATSHAIGSIGFVARRKNPPFAVNVSVTINYVWSDPPSIGTYRIDSHIDFTAGGPPSKPARIEMPVRIAQDGSLSVDTEFAMSEMVKHI